jgi:hypothetical protein
MVMGRIANQMENLDKKYKKEEEELVGFISTSKCLFSSCTAQRLMHF